MHSAAAKLRPWLADLSVGVNFVSAVISAGERPYSCVRWVSRTRSIMENVLSADFLGRVFATMALTPQHTYQILTKRPNRMRELLTNGRVHAAMRTALVDVSISDRCKLARRDNQLDASPGGHMSMAVAECVAGNVDRV